MNDSESEYSLYITKMIPSQLFLQNATNIQVAMMNSFTLRDFLYQGRVTRNDVFSIMPFEDVFYYFQGLSGQQLQNLIDYLENGDEKIDFEKRYEAYKPSSVPSYVPLPRWLYSEVDIQPTNTYDVICSGYDSVSIGKALQKLDPNGFHKKSYPNQMDSDDVIRIWIQQNWPCKSL